jgi:hypothetical protein
MALSLFHGSVIRIHAIRMNAVLLRTTDWRGAEVAVCVPVLGEQLSSVTPIHEHQGQPRRI